MMESITSLQNRKVKIWTSLQHKKGRDSHRLFLVETEHLIEEAQKAQILQTIISDQKGDILVTEYHNQRFTELVYAKCLILKKKK